MKRVLIICYYWPPAGGPGVQRWLKFVKYLPEFGIDPVVFVPQGATYPLEDPSLLGEVNPKLEILRCPIKEPYRLAGILSRKKTKQISSGLIPKDKKNWKEQLLLAIRGNFFIPDARVGWVDPAVRYLEQYLTEQSVDAIVTTGPPHSLHLIGEQLKQRFDLPWLADFRDPWTTIHYHKDLKLGKRARNLHEQMEARVLNSADQILVTSPGTQQEFEGKTSRPVTLITNGFDQRPRGGTLTKKFSITHIGSLLTERNPAPIWKALSELLKEETGLKEDLEVNLAGVVGAEVRETIASFGLEPFVVDHGYVQHQAALALQSESQLLLLLEMNKPETRAIIPGKLFEYMSSERPILALGPKGSDVASILTESRAGQFFDWEQAAEIKSALSKAFDQYKASTLNGGSKQLLDQYSRRNLTKDLAAVLNAF